MMIVATRAFTIEGLAIKAAVAQRILADEGDDQELAPLDDGTILKGLIVSIMSIAKAPSL